MSSKSSAKVSVGADGEVRDKPSARPTEHRSFPRPLWVSNEAHAKIRVRAELRKLPAGAVVDDLLQERFASSQLPSEEPCLLSPEERKLVKQVFKTLQAGGTAGDVRILLGRAEAKDMLLRL